MNGGPGRQPSKQSLDRECAAFNLCHPVGTWVRYWKMAKHGEPSGMAKISHRASVLSGHTAVVWLEGVSGCIALSHVEPATMADLDQLRAVEVTA